MQPDQEVISAPRNWGAYGESPCGQADAEGRRAESYRALGSRPYTLASFSKIEVDSVHTAVFLAITQKMLPFAGRSRRWQIGHVVAVPLITLTSSRAHNTQWIALH